MSTTDHYSRHVVGTNRTSAKQTIGLMYSFTYACDDRSDDLSDVLEDLGYV